MANVEPMVAARILRRYGVTALDYAAMLLAQHGRCAVCMNVVAPLHVDHSHVTNKVRGLVCRPCNTGMGMFGDSADLLYAAAEYLEYHEGE